MLKRSLLYPVLSLVILTVLPVSAFALAQISISSPKSDGVFIVTGAGMDGVAGMQLSVSYDSATLSNPRVMTGSLVSGMLNAINPANPIQMGLVNPAKTISGGGTIATITFDRTGTSPGSITAVTGFLADVDTHKMAMAAPVIINPSTVQQAGDGTDASTVTVTGTGKSPSFIAGGTLTFPPNEALVADKKDAHLENVERQAASGEPVPPVSETLENKAQAPKEAATAQPEPAPRPIQSVLERFRLFQGERTTINLAALFNKESGTSFSQSPAIAIADGKAMVKLTISKVAGAKAPNFAFNSARYVSLTRLGDGEWEIEVRPDLDAVKASVSMLSNGTLQEFPLTVTPKVEVQLSKSGGVSEADFLLFLKERGTAAAPKFDLNKDGKRDYLDDYIFTANYLVKMDERANKKKTAQ